MKQINFLTFIAVLISIISCGEKQKEFISLPNLFSDNMVLQQNTEVAIWGETSAKANITVKGSWGNEVTIQANDKGEWLAKIRTKEAVNESFELLIISKDTTIILKNILLGEVWLASGQSNMEMPVSGWLPNDTILNSANEIENSANENIRMFTVARDLAFAEKKNCKGSWEISDPKTTGNFSATAYFFAKKLYKELNVPVGIIHSSWGGTPVESWIRTDYLEKDVDYKDVITKIKKSLPQIDELKNWLDSLPKIELLSENGTKDFAGVDYNDLQCAEADFDDSEWKIMNLPISWENDKIGDFDGVVWFRKKIKIPENWKNQELIVELGPIDDMDVTFLNAKQIGETMNEGLWQKERVYSIPADAFEGGENTLSVRVVDNQGGGGICGVADQMKIYRKGNKEEAISLSGKWKYLPTAEYKAESFRMFDIETQAFYQRPDIGIVAGSHTPTVLYNAMIAPLAPYTIKGAIWYQGESNVGRHEQYARIFPTMINSWRDSWQQRDFPFYYVQIAPYNYGEGSNSGALRNAQRLSLSTPNTGMIVSLDIGNVNNIHPANKQDIGKRLASWALNKDYAKEVNYSGPLYKSKVIKNGKIILSFTEIGSGLELKEDEVSGFEIAGDDGIFVQARAEIDGDQVVISSTKVKQPKQVRYAWADAAKATLFNKEGLPASTFVTN